MELAHSAFFIFNYIFHKIQNMRGRIVFVRSVSHSACAGTLLLLDLIHFKRDNSLYGKSKP